MAEQCSKCAYYEDALGGEGQCLRYPPNTFSLVDDGIGVVAKSFFPTVDPTSWCGEYYPLDDDSRVIEERL